MLNSNMFSNLKTKRLLLRPMLASDAQRLFEYRSDPEVSRYQNWEPKSVEEVARFIGNITPNPDTPGSWHQIGIAHGDTNCLVGDIGLHVLAREPEQVELGITLAPRFQGQGFATEALSGILEYVFTTLEKHRVFCSVDPQNHAVLALLKRVGLRQEAHMIESYKFKGEWVDDVIFAMLAREWPDSRNRHGT